MEKTALITGILGQDGPYLAKLLLEKDYKVYGMMQRYSNPNFENLDFLGIRDKVDLVTGDMTDECSLNNLIKAIRPEEVYNLAAQSFVGASWDQPEVTSEVNFLGPLYLLNAIKLFSPRTKFYQASTSELFGNSSDNGIQNENTAFHPRSPYGIAKLGAYWTANNFKESYNIFACNGILFNHESPIRGREFVTRKISEGVAKIKLGLAKEISLGNLDAKRDWGFAGDYVEAMWRMMQQDEPDNYVICTGEHHSIKDFLGFAFNHAGIKDWEQFIKVDPRYKRLADIFTLLGDSTKAREAFGWQPKVHLEELVAMMVDADIKRLSAL